MLWRYLRLLLRFIVPPPALALPVMPLNAQCPVCGHTEGHEIKCVKVQIGNSNHTAITAQTTCGTCQARWHREPVGGAATANTIWEAANSEVKLPAPTFRMVR